MHPSLPFRLVRVCCIAMQHAKLFASDPLPTCEGLTCDPLGRGHHRHVPPTWPWPRTTWDHVRRRDGCGFGERTCDADPRPSRTSYGRSDLAGTLPSCDGKVPEDARGPSDPPSRMRIDSPPSDPGMDRATWTDPIGSLGSGGAGRAGGIATWPSPRPFVPSTPSVPRGRSIRRSRSMDSRAWFVTLRLQRSKRPSSSMLGRDHPHFT